MEIYSLTADGDVITKWEKEFVTERENFQKRQMVDKIRTINIL